MTAPASTREHIDAIVAALEAASLTVYPGGAPEGATGNYVTVYAAGGLSGNHTGTLGDVYRDLTVSFQTTAVADTHEQALLVHDKTVTALLGAAPSVSGRSPQPIWFDEAPQPVRRDDAAAQPRYLAVARWVFRTSV